MAHTPFSLNMGEYPHSTDFVEPRDVSIGGGSKIGISFNKFGLLKSIQLDENQKNFPVHLEFLKYGVRDKPEKSGAYLFLPDGPAMQMALDNPTVLFSKGIYESSVSSGLPFALHETILRDGDAIEIRNLIDIGDMVNTEIIMRLSTGIKSNDTFYTDLNGFQVIN